MALDIDTAFVEQVQDALDKAAQHAPKRCREFLSADMIARVIRAATKHVELEETLVQVFMVTRCCGVGTLVYSAMRGITS